MSNFLFLYTLPFALVHDLKWLTFLATFILTVGYFGLEIIASEMENPFGLDEIDLPLQDTMIDIELKVREIFQEFELRETPAVAFDVRSFLEVDSSTRKTQRRITTRGS